MRTELCDEALRVGRILARPGAGRARGARPRGADGNTGVAQRRAGRRRTARRSCCSSRTAPAGTRFSSVAGLRRSTRPSGSAARLGPYALQAAIAACHARAQKAADTDWRRIAALYDELSIVTPSPIDRAQPGGGPCHGVWSRGGAATAGAGDRRRGARATIICCPACAAISSHRLGRFDEARAEFARAADLTRNERERALLLGRAAGQA